MKPRLHAPALLDGHAVQAAGTDTTHIVVSENVLNVRILGEQPAKIAVIGEPANQIVGELTSEPAAPVA